MHIAEKYTTLARDAMSSGDSVAAENYLQHAEHYNRIILAAQLQNGGAPAFDQQGMNGINSRFHQPEAFQRDFDGDGDGDGDDGDGDDFAPQQPHQPRQPQQRSFPERQPYNQNQPQPVIPQNAFPHAQPQLQPVTPPLNGNAPHVQDGFPGLPEAPAPRRRRRRPIGEAPAKGFNGRHGGQGAVGANGSEGGDPAPDEAAS